MQKSFLVGIGAIVYLLTLFVTPSEVLAAAGTYTVTTSGSK